MSDNKSRFNNCGISDNGTSEYSSMEKVPTYLARGRRDKRINDLNVQIREVATFLSNYLSRNRRIKLVHNDLQKFTDEQINEFLQKIRNATDWYFDTKTQITEYASDQPIQMQEIYIAALRAKRTTETRGLRELFLQAQGDKNPDPELLNELANLTINANSGPTKEQALSLRKDFPTGNFMLHTTDILATIRIIEGGS